MQTYEIGTTPQFRDAMARLDPVARSDVYQAAEKVMDGLSSAHVHKLEDTGFVAFGVNRNALRVICERDGDLLILLHVGAHDAAYEWAKRHRTVRIGRVVRFVSIPTEVAAVSSSEGDRAAPEGPLAGVRDRVFAHFGIGPHGARVLRATNDDELIEVAELMRPALAEAVTSLASDPDALAAILRAYEEAQRAAEAAPAAKPLADVARDVVNAGSIWLPRSMAALKDAMEGRLEDWQVFLHPSQEALVRKRLTGAAKVTGGPGTGKTVVALHRARFLAENPFDGDERPVLLTTFSRTLTEQLESMVERMDGDGSLAGKLEVVSLVAACQRVLREAERPHALLTDEALAACWEAALEHDEIGWSQRMYASEREHVVARAGAWTGTQYLTVTRSGRETRIRDRATRRKVWKVLEAFEAAMAAAGGGDAVALARDASRVLGSGEVRSPWRSVVCDEVQDASASQLRMLSAVARDPGSGQTRPDGLFLCGDGYQRLYASPVSLVSCGIEVRGRSRRLRLNYRTTEGIRRAAIEVVKGLDLDELESLGDGEDTPFDGYRSLRGGPLPVSRSFASEEEEAEWLAELAAEPLLVLVRSKAYRGELAERLRARGVPVHVLEGRGQVAEEGVTLCTLHRSKGLEAPRVVVAGRQLVPGRFPGGDAGDRVLWERGERCLLYVGMTRARDWLGVCGVV